MLHTSPNRTRRRPITPIPIQTSTRPRPRIETRIQRQPRNRTIAKTDTQSRARARAGILHGAVRREELRRQVVLSNAGVGTREGVPLVTKGAHPDPRRVVDAGVRVEDAAAAGADQGVVGEDGELGEPRERGAHDAERDDEGGGLGLGGGPRVPRPPEPFDRFQLDEVHRGAESGGDKGRVLRGDLTWVFGVLNDRNESIRRNSEEEEEEEEVVLVAKKA